MFEAERFANRVGGAGGRINAARAIAASVAVSMAIPLTYRVEAVAMMMKKATSQVKNEPTITS